jgi:hypothetical protein
MAAGASAVPAVEIVKKNGVVSSNKLSNLTLPHEPFACFLQSFYLDTIHIDILGLMDARAIRIIRSRTSYVILYRSNAEDEENLFYLLGHTMPAVESTSNGKKSVSRQELASPSFACQPTRLFFINGAIFRLFFLPDEKNRVTFYNVAEARTVDSRTGAITFSHDLLPAPSTGTKYILKMSKTYMDEIPTMPMVHIDATMWTYLFFSNERTNYYEHRLINAKDVDPEEMRTIKEYSSVKMPPYRGVVLTFYKKEIRPHKFHDIIYMTFANALYPEEEGKTRVLPKSFTVIAVLLGYGQLGVCDFFVV